MLYFFFFSNFTKIYLIYNIVLVSGVQQSDSVIHIYMYISGYFSLVYYKILNIVSVLHTKLLFTYFFICSVYLLIYFALLPWFFWLFFSFCNSRTKRKHIFRLKWIVKLGTKAHWLLDSKSISCGNFRNGSVNFPESLIPFNSRNTLTCQKGKKKKGFKTNWRKQNFR